MALSAVGTQHGAGTSRALTECSRLCTCQPTIISINVSVSSRLLQRTFAKPLAKPVKARRTDAGNVLVDTQVRRQRDAKDTDLVTHHDRFSSKLQGRTSAPQQSRTMT